MYCYYDEKIKCFCTVFILNWETKHTTSFCNSMISGFIFNPLFHNVEKWPNILYKSCGFHTARFLKYAWQFFQHYEIKG